MHDDRPCRHYRRRLRHEDRAGAAARADPRRRRQHLDGEDAEFPPRLRRGRKRRVPGHADRGIRQSGGRGARRMGIHGARLGARLRDPHHSRRWRALHYSGAEGEPHARDHAGHGPFHCHRHSPDARPPRRHQRGAPHRRRRQALRPRHHHMPDHGT